MSIIITFIQVLFYVMYLAIVARVLLSWVNLAPDHPVSRLLFEMTEPILAPLRRMLPMVGALDISPVVALMLLEVIRWILTALLNSLRR
jgi:YggT family protein